VLVASHPQHLLRSVGSECRLSLKNKKAPVSSSEMEKSTLDPRVLDNAAL
jgi:hypothetical protein